METRVPIKITAHDQLCIERVPHRPCGIVIFGASGDLAQRKLIPSLFNLFREKLLPPKFFILGTGRKNWTDNEFKKYFSETLARDPKRDPELIQKLCEMVYYSACSYEQAETFFPLKEKVDGLAAKHQTGANLISYLALPPEVYLSTIENMVKAKILIPDASEMPATQLVVEKPFGQDLASARSLTENSLGGLSERQIYRIDHYLGKETVQNILMFRFANSIFEAVWNRQYIDHIQITAAETLGVEHRAGYYDNAGVLKDMFQNHMLELLTLVAMEPPLNFDPQHYRDEKVKLLRSIRTLTPETLKSCFVRGQYAAGKIKDKGVPAYRSEPGVRADSQTETFAALKVFIDNWRWQGVPFYLRSGKRLPNQDTEIIIQFKPITHSIFSRVAPDQIPANKLIIQIQPDEGIQIGFNAKHPGPKMCMATLGLEFNYATVFDEKDLSAYERLILDCMHGDPTLFVRQDMVEVSWALVETLLKQGRQLPLLGYESGTWGPKEADQLMTKDGRSWNNV